MQSASMYRTHAKDVPGENLDDLEDYLIGTPSGVKDEVNESKRTLSPSRQRSTSQESSQGDNEVTAQYMGTLNPSDLGPGLLKQLAASLAELQKGSYMFLEESEITHSDSEIKQEPKEQNSVPRSRTVSCSETLCSDSSKAEKKSQKGKKTAKRIESESPGRRSPRLKKGKGTEKKTSSPRTPRKKSKEKSKVNSDDSNSTSKSKSSQLDKVASSESINITANPIVKESEASTSTPSPGKRKLKTKKERDKSRTRSKHTDNSVSSGGSGDDKKKSSNGTSRGRRKVKTDKIVAEMVREYLHASSSSDVDLESAKKGEVGEKSASTDRLVYTSISVQWVRNSRKVRNVPNRIRY